ncbi:MAG: hypothetical protein J6B87_05655 [Clostridia bacterium]|nr:hypothetical protein [Clostridia bacterium]
MTFGSVVFTIFMVFNVIFSAILIKLNSERRYVAEIAKKFGRDEFEKYQLFFDKEKLQQVLKELKISGRTTDMLLEAKNYILLISHFDVKLYYALPGTEYALMPYEEASAKNIFTIIEKAAIKPINQDNILYFSKYEAGG